MTYLCIAHSPKLPAMATGRMRSHSHVGSCMRLTHHQIAAMPAPYMTPTCTRPWYHGLISETYFSRNWRWRSVIMAGLLRRGRLRDILVVDQESVKAPSCLSPPRNHEKNARSRT